MERSLTTPIKELAFSDHKIALVSGPRQCGKTTLGKMLLAERKVGGYHNWDDVSFRRMWTKEPTAMTAELTTSSVVPLLVLDEIHKARGWKRTLKGLYDTRERPFDLIVTGSARLNVYKKGGDSLLGRALHFRLHPLSVAELTAASLPGEPDERIGALFTHATRVAKEDPIEPLLRFGGFPEPFLAANERKARVWRHSRIEKVLREDLRDLSRIPELSRVEMLASLLPERVGSPLSRASLREDLEVSFDSVTRWLGLLSELYYTFELKPYARSVARSLKRESKLYLWDWSEVQEPGARFENLVAVHLLKACDFWTDSGEGTFDLKYLRNKEKEEIDFLIVRDGKPWLPVEVKLNDTEPLRHWRKFVGYLGCRRALQLVCKPGWFRRYTEGDTELIVASAGDALRYFA
jgi:uncharacterized protein